MKLTRILVATFTLMILCIAGALSPVYSQALPPIPRCTPTNAACIERQAVAHDKRAVVFETRGQASAEAERAMAAEKRVIAATLKTPPIVFTPIPVPPFVPDPFVAPSLAGLPAIASNFDRAAEILPSQNGVPISAAPDDVGAFRFICQPGQINWDDPIVYPGVIGGSPHLHQWFGNSLANGTSTYKSLRTTGESTCMGPMNRSAYWQPAMMNEAGQVVRPDWISIYYKRVPKSNPQCGPSGVHCVALPRGLRYIFGFDMKRMHEPQPENQHFYWKCVTPQNTLRGGLEKRFDAMDCPAGNALMVTMASPDCWDGKNLDSTDHRSHIVHRVNNPANGRAECPATHQYVVPQFTIGAGFTVGAGENVKNWHLSSDRMTGMAALPAGTSFHADWYGAWDDDVLKTWTDNCIDKLLNCSAGELGDGTILRRPAGYGFIANPRLVPVPVKP